MVLWTWYHAANRGGLGCVRHWPRVIFRWDNAPRSEGCATGS